MARLTDGRVPLGKYRANALPRWMRRREVPRFCWVLRQRPGAVLWGGPAGAGTLGSACSVGRPAAAATVSWVSFGYVGCRKSLLNAPWPTTALGNCSWRFRWRRRAHERVCLQCSAVPRARVPYAAGKRSV